LHQRPIRRLVVRLKGSGWQERATLRLIDTGAHPFALAEAAD
jgi:hypothetical protein